jgi:hypothetical protein
VIIGGQAVAGHILENDSGDGRRQKLAAFEILNYGARMGSSAARGVMNRLSVTSRGVGEDRGARHAVSPNEQTESSARRCCGEPPLTITGFGDRLNWRINRPAPVPAFVHRKYAAGSMFGRQINSFFGQ